MESVSGGRGWLRFTLRTVLIVTLVICAWLAWTVNRAHRQRELLTELERCEAYPCFAFGYDEQGNEVEEPVDWEPSALAEWLAPWLGEEYFLPPVVGAMFYEAPPSPKAIELLERLPELRVLSFNAANVPQPILDQVKSLSQLQRLEVAGATNELLPHIAQMKCLKRLTLDGTVTSVKCLTELKHLEELNVFSVSLPPEALEEIAQLAGLQKVGLRGLSADADLMPLAKLQGLRVLDLHDVNVKFSTLRTLYDEMPDLEFYARTSSGNASTLTHQPSKNQLLAMRRVAPK